MDARVFKIIKICEKNGKLQKLTKIRYNVEFLCFQHCGREVCWCMLRNAQNVDVNMRTT